MKILLADDHALSRVGLEMIVKSTLPDADIIFAEDWQEVHHHIQQQRFDFALLDLFMPRERLWEEELTQCVKSAPNLPICIVTSSSIKSHVLVALDIGVKGFVCKTSGLLEIKKAVLNIASGKRYMPNFSDAKAEIGLNKMTERQKEVLVLLAKGKQNKEIASRSSKYSLNN